MSELPSGTVAFLFTDIEGSRSGPCAEWPVADVGKCAVRERTDQHPCGFGSPDLDEDGEAPVQHGGELRARAQVASGAHSLVQETERSGSRSGHCSAASATCNATAASTASDAFANTACAPSPVVFTR